MPILNNLEYVVISSGITWDEEGIVEGNLVASIGQDSAVAKALSINNHPDYSWMLRSGGRVTAKEAGLSEISLQFIGIDPNLDGQVTSSIRAATSTEPIDTHPTFGSGVGKDDAQGNLVVDGWAANFNPQFNEDGSIKKFPPELEVRDPENGPAALKDVANPKAGVESYLEPTVTFQQSKIFAKTSAKNLASHCKALGKIDDDFFKGSGIPKPPTPMGDHGKPRDWLLVSAGYEAIGEGGRSQRCGGCLDAGDGMLLYMNMIMLIKNNYA